MWERDEERERERRGEGERSGKLWKEIERAEDERDTARQTD